MPAKRRFDNGLVNTEAGSIPHTDYLLLGFHLMDVQVDDRFTHNNLTYRVTGIYPSREERTLCSIDYRGEPNG